MILIFHFVAGISLIILPLYICIPFVSRCRFAVGTVIGYPVIEVNVYIVTIDLRHFIPRFLGRIHMGAALYFIPLYVVRSEIVGIIGHHNYSGLTASALWSIRIGIGICIKGIA